MDFRSHLGKLILAIENLTPEDLLTEDSLTDFTKKKKAYKAALFEQIKKDLISSLKILGDPINTPIIEKISPMLNKLENESDLEKIKEITNKIQLLEKDLVYPKKEKSLTFKIPNIPREIKQDMKADLHELEKCFKQDCFRASIILCGRLLEIALHRKYYEATKIDVLEKNPGIGLGTLVAKLKEKNISLDPAISQQIHLINQVRIFSVHRKKEQFNPNKNQTQAIILYTIDIIRKLFQ